MTPVHELAAVRPVQSTPGHALPIGSRLREYEIKALIGEGTCSIVYLGWDHALQRKVAIKEYMPAAMAGRFQGSTSVVVASERHVEIVNAGMRSFLNEARVLARFDHPSLVKIYRFWEENGTAYTAMPYYEGPTLRDALAELGHVPSEAELRAWLKPILNAVTLLHEGGTWHQNIAPDEILLTPFGPVLLGFAGAAHAIEAFNHTPAAALKPGYAAIEQYGSEAATTRGPWTDLYALAAVVYAAITGSDPPPAADRLTEDRLRPLTLIAAGLYSERFLAAIDAALAVQPRRRPADHAEFRALMGDIDAPEAVSLAPRPDLMQEPFAGAPAGNARGDGARPGDPRDRSAGADGCGGRSAGKRQRVRRDQAATDRGRGRRHRPRAADVDADDAGARPRQARGLRRHRRHVRADRHRRARAAVRDQADPARRVAGRRLGSAQRRRTDDGGPCAADAGTCRDPGDDGHEPCAWRAAARDGKAVDADARADHRARAPTDRRRRRSADPRRDPGSARPAAGCRAAGPTGGGGRRDGPHRARKRGDRRFLARGAPGALHRDPAEGVAREDHAGRNRLLQARMQVSRFFVASLARAAALASGLAIVLVACTTSEPQTFEKAATEATDRLVAQTGKLPAFLATIESTLAKPDPKAPRRTVTIDPMLDTVTGQQTETTMLFERRVVERLGSAYPQFEILPFQSANLSRAQYLLTGTLARVPTAPLGKPTVRLNLALTELRTGMVVAQAWSLAREENLDQTPSRYYRDVPVLIKDKIVEGYAKTSTTPAGQHADAYYLERLGAASVISEATTLYNAEKYQDALGQYRSALATPQGEQLRVQSGIYLSSMRLGNVAEAEQAFGRIVALGIDYNELGVKFLFNPGSVDFWSDPKISGAYGMWLRQIAREAMAAHSCIAIIGHTSRSGPGPVNDALSLKRAQYVRQRLLVEAPELAGRTRAEGMGFRQNIVGSGTDDAFDVLDRRVEFRMIPCG